MKQKISKHVLLVSFLLVGMVFSFSKVAFATEEAKKKVYTTVCCLNGNMTGIANDCVSGSGACVDHFCAQGETETGANCILP